MLGIAAYFLAPPQPADARWRYTEAQVRLALERSQGFISIAAKRLHCSRTTVYAYLDRYPQLREIGNDHQESLLDVAEVRLAEDVKKGVFKAYRFLLITKGKKRGYTVRQEVTGTDGGAVVVKVLSGVSMDDL